jgi:hypothetical protein
MAVPAISQPATVLPEVTVTASKDPTNTNPDAPSYVNVPNPLFAYPSWTYSLSIHLVSKDDWNNIVNTGQYTATNVLIASAGRYDNSSFIRNHNFTDDFYIDDLRMVSTIGTTEKNSGSNNIEMSFSVYEPYGVTLLDRLIYANKELTPSEHNYLKSVYLLQIDFYGSDDGANLVHPIPNQTKYIPITLLSMDISVNSKGSEYKFSAVPFVHDAFSQTSQQNPANFEITAETVKDFFSAATTAPSTEQTDNRDSGTISGYGVGGSTAKSYATAVNEWNNQLKNNNEIEVADIVDFIFDDEIGSAKIVENGKLPPRSAPYSDISNQQAIARGDLTGLSADINFNIKNYPINAGDTIESILYNVVRNSSYIRSQIVNPTDYNGDLAKYNAAKKTLENEPFWWYKIIPQIKLLDYDKIRNRRARQITYYIKKYAITNMKLDYAPGGKARTPIKVYNYIYTGLNKDILDLDIKFNAAFYTAVTSDPGKLMTDQGAANETENATKIDSSNQDTPNAIQPIQKVPLVADPRSNPTGGAQSSTAVLASDAVKSILNSSQGDMLNIHLKITGDPTFIKQDEIFYTPVVNEQSVGLTKNNSIKTDGSQVHVQVSFNAPVDLDESTAPKMRIDPRFSYGLFSGMYNVLTIESEFSRGQFTQKLDMVRLPNQSKLDYTDGADFDSASEQRNSDSLTTSFNDINVINVDSAIKNAVTGGISQVTQSLTQAVNKAIPALNEITSGIETQSASLSNILNTAPKVSINDQNAPNLAVPPKV